MTSAPENDDNLPADSADRFAAAYIKRGGQIHVEKFHGEPHTFVSRDPNSPASRAASGSATQS